MSAPHPQDPSYESELALRLLAALERGDTPVAVHLQGQIIGLHYARLRAYVSAHLPSPEYPHTHVEDVFSEAVAKMFEELWNPDTLLWVKPGRSFAQLFWTMAKDEIAAYLGGRSPYRDDRRLAADPHLEPPTGEQDDCIGEWIDRLAAEESSERIIAGAGGLSRLDGLLLHLVYVEEIPLVKVRPLLRLAQRGDRPAAAAEAALLLGVTAEIAAQFLEMIRSCRDATPHHYNALKTRMHRIRRRAQRRIEDDDETRAEDDTDADDEDEANEEGWESQGERS